MQEGTFSALIGRLSFDEPQIRDAKRAAVSVILSNRVAPAILLIRRAEKAGDPWSGQVAFPGGKSQETDGSARGTAARETREEVGVDLDEASDFLGYFRPFRTHTGAMEVIPCVFLLKGRVVVSINLEVSSYRWLSLDRLLSPEATSSHEIGPQGGPREVPAFKVGDYVIWGLTHSIISSLLSPKGTSV